MIGSLKQHRHFPCVNVVYKLFALSVSWCLGAIIGYAFYLYTGNSYLRLIQLLPYTRVTFVGLLCVIYLPFLLLLISVYYSVDYFIYCLACLKSVTFIFVGCLVYSFYLSAGWLMQLLMLFSTSISTILQFHFLCCYFLKGKDVIRSWVAQYIGITFMLFFLDYFVFSRFLQTLSY